MAAGAGQAAPYTGGFRTHDDNPNSSGSSQLNVPRSSIPQNYNPNTQAYSPAQSQPTGGNATIGANTNSAPKGTPSGTDPATQNYLRQCEELEMKRDFQGAVTLLRQALNDNLQNSEIHHRLAVNLLNLGQITESVSEFRIASALKPTDKTYADDLARALNIHKRSLMSDSTGNTAQSQAQSQGGQEQK